MNEYITFILVIISLYGAWAITVPVQARRGFAAWIIADLAWAIYFGQNGQVGPSVLFLIYMALAVKGCRA